ncbi:MAG: UPF0179 family protein [Candidatus Hermodarchaeota archaeon]
MDQNSSSNNRKKTVHTLLSKRVAEKGWKFIFEGETASCTGEDCRLSGVCLGKLKEGRLYEVDTVKNIKHDCQVHDGGVVTVTVKEADFNVLVISNFATEGATLKFTPNNCKNINCEFFRKKICNPPFLKKDDIIKVIKIKEKINCPIGEKFTLIEAICIS